MGVDLVEELADVEEEFEGEVGPEAVFVVVRLRFGEGVDDTLWLLADRYMEKLNVMTDSARYGRRRMMLQRRGIIVTPRYALNPLLDRILSSPAFCNLRDPDPLPYTP